jgi:hypothetical protein
MIHLKLADLFLLISYSTKIDWPQENIIINTQDFENRRHEYVKSDVYWQVSYTY